MRGFGRSPEEELQREINRALRERDAQIQSIRQRLQVHERALRWFTDERLGNHLTQRDHFETATKYNGIVLGIGYAGFFGLWSMVKDQGSQYPRLHAFAALLTGLSLIVFVFWEIYCMYVNTIAITHPKALEPSKQRFIRWAHRAHDNLEKVWPWTFFVTVLSGLGGIGCLGYILAANVVLVLRG